MSNWILITFGDGSTGWRQAARRLKFQASKTQLFQAVEVLDDKWLANFDPQIRNIQMKILETSSRGHGYYVWKPSVLWYANLLYPEHHICYVDAGSDLKSDQHAILNLKRLLNQAEMCGYSFQLGAHPEKHWTKKRVREYLNMSQDELESNQIQSGFICLPANIDRGKFIHEWRSAAVIGDGLLFSDDLDENEDDSLIEHRHDQSVFSVLWKRHKFNYGADESDPVNSANSAIIAGRNPTFFPLYTIWFIRAGMIKINKVLDAFNVLSRNIHSSINPTTGRRKLWKND